MPLLALGRHTFEIDGLNFQELEEETTVKWPAINRFGGRPGHQMTGYGEDPIVINGLIYPEEIGGRSELDALRVTQRLARPVVMVGWSTDKSNAARVYGLVAIPSIRATHSRFGPDGNSRKISFSVEVVPIGGIAGFTGGLY